MKAKFAGIGKIGLFLLVGFLFFGAIPCFAAPEAYINVTVELTPPTGSVGGFVYDSLTGEGLAGADVSIYEADTHGLVDTKTTGPDGRFDIYISSGEYYLGVIIPGYDGVGSEIIAVPEGDGVGGVPESVDGTYHDIYYGKTFTIASSLHFDIPVDQEGAEPFKLTKDANKEEVVPGDIVTYTLEATNEGDEDAVDLAIRDRIPFGFKYLEGTTLIDDSPAPDPTGKRTLIFAISSIPSEGSVTLSYQLVVGSGVKQGEKYRNKAAVRRAGGDSANLSNVAEEFVEVTYDPLFDLSTILGKVFWDQNANGVQDRGESGIPYAMIATEDGTLIRTDKDGKYHLAGVAPGTHVLRLDESSLPDGAALTTEKARVVRTTEGLLAKVNFGVELPEGTASAEAEPTSPEAPAEEKENHLFLVALAEGELGHLSHSGSVEAIQYDDRFDPHYYTQGKLAYYLKAKVRGKYFITSSLDTQREKKELFRRLDPDKYYPIYGDSSSVSYDAADTQGNFYLLVEWDKSSMLWGNYTTGLTETDLAQYARTLYGGKVSFSSVATTQYGDPRTILVAFDSSARQLAAHNEFTGTGGSLYYLKDKDVVEGSEQVALEVRDKVTGITVASLPMEEGVDYRIDYSNGRIVFFRPISAITQTETIISDAILDGNRIYVVVDYEYEPDGHFKKGSEGGRLSQQLTDHIRVGGTYVKESKDDRDYELTGSDLTIKLGKGEAKTTLHAEYAQSEAEEVGNYLSTDGGLSFTQVSTSGEGQGSAYSFRAKSKLTDMVGLDAYYKRIKPGFSTASTISDQGTKKYGTSLSARLTESTTLSLGHDYQELLSGANDASANQVGAQEARTSTAQLVHSREKLTLTGEYRNQEVISGLTPQTERREQDELVAGRVDYRPTDRVGVFVEQQATVSGPTNDQTTAGLEAKLTERTSFYAQGTDGTKGTSALVGLSSRVSEKTDTYVSLSVENAGEEGRASTVTTGGSTQLSERSWLYGERQYRSSRDESARATILGWEGQPNDRLGLSLAFERADVANLDGSDTTRKAGSLGLTYLDKFPDGDTRLRASTKFEARFDDGGEEERQYLTWNQLEYCLNQDLSFFGKANYSRTKDEDADDILSELSEYTLGAAYRPTAFDRLNLLAKYTYLQDLSPEDQSDNAAISEEKSSIYSVEAVYDINQHLQLVEKFANKQGKERVGNRDFTDTETYLWVNRLNLRLTPGWVIAGEYRILEQDEAHDKKEGFLFEVNRRLGPYLQLGLGYNFTDFTDDLRPEDEYSGKGPFVRLTGMLYDGGASELESAAVERREIERKERRILKERINSHLDKAVSYYKEGSYEESIQEFYLVLALDPDNRTAQKYLNKRIPAKIKTQEERLEEEFFEEELEEEFLEDERLEVEGERIDWEDWR